MKKLITMLGSTGSIGLSTLSIINKKKNYFKVHLLSANKNYSLIHKQIKKYKPVYFVVTDYKIYLKVKKNFKKNKTKIFNDFKSISNLNKSDITISAIPGISGLQPTIFMTQFSKKILLANKEAIICGWNLIKAKAKKYNTKIIPVDSEHFSIFKLLHNHKINEISKVYLTASGGPFLNMKANQLNKIKPSQAFKHPKWKMGKKISIDSSTLMNKMLELIEAQKLFNIPYHKLDILIHPDSLVHAIVDFKNGLKKFIYHETSMIIPIANAIFDGDLNIENFYRRKKNNKIENLFFQKVDPKIFPVIKLKDKVNEYPSTPIIINASNEILVDQFIKKKIPFLSIQKIILAILDDKNYKKYAIKTTKNISQINKIDLWAKSLTMKKIKLYNE